MINPLVSIIVPCYNQAQYLSEALQSVLTQTYQNWECIIVNDGSPDNTEQVAKMWLEKDKRFQYIYKQNGGLSSARNAGLEQAQGDFVLFLDSDDFVAPDKILLSVEAFHKDSNLDVVLSDYNVVYGTSPQKKLPFVKLSGVNFNFETIVNHWDINFTIPIHCAVFKRSSIGNTRFNENLQAKEDWLFWIQFFKKSFNAIFINQQLVTYRMHNNSMTKAASYMHESQDLVINFIKQELTSTEYEHFLMERLQFYKGRFLENSLKYATIKNSLTYRFALKIKRIVSKIGLLQIVKSLFQKLTK